MISFKLYREYGALNSSPVFDAFQQGIKHTGNSIVDLDEDVAVIWSVLWKGRMHGNLSVYQARTTANKPTIIIEVGNLIRGKTWRISMHNVNRLGYFGNTTQLDCNRPATLGVTLKDCNTHRNSEILITGQHEASLQWSGLPSTAEWVTNLVTQIRCYTDRPIKFRPHPRSNISVSNLAIDYPKKISGTYDDYNMNYNYHCIINHNSGPTVQSAINGTPIICHSSSLAFPVSDIVENIDNPVLLDRSAWFLELCHTEWTVDEIAAGIPLQRLIPTINSYLTS